MRTKNPEPTTTFTFRLPPADKALIQKAAWINKRSAGNFTLIAVMAAAREFLAQHTDQPTTTEVADDNPVTR